ncbi:PIN domain-containing protein [Nocardia uniformis]|uniref:PIN domain-containing protein n=1 Tax=Nocardia uniformis TaxID=53432 RepID=A0A849BYP3_9NOCA|nr:PIN domain-containing protein [Nocardia uniformis]NNH70236.1 PIN domain-containing protein [Nocardia uniformis]
MSGLGSARALYLVDHSAVSRIRTSVAVRKAFDRLSDDVAVLCSNVVTLDEACYSARNRLDLDRIVHVYSAVYHFLPMDPGIDRIVRAIRSGLWAQGHGRSAQATDILIAATAVHYDATVLHYDNHFELMAAAYPDLRHQWIVPRGTADRI